MTDHHKQLRPAKGREYLASEFVRPGVQESEGPRGAQIPRQRSGMQSGRKDCGGRPSSGIARSMAVEQMHLLETASGGNLGGRIRQAEVCRLKRGEIAPAVDHVEVFLVRCCGLDKREDVSVVRRYWRRCDGEGLVTG